MKAYTPDHTPVFSDLPPVVSLDGFDVIPEAILDRCLMKKGNRAVPQVLIKWTKLSDTSATWEDFYVVQQCFLDALAWGHARSLGGICYDRWSTIRGKGTSGEGVNDEKTWTTRLGERGVCYVVGSGGR